MPRPRPMLRREFADLQTFLGPDPLNLLMIHIPARFASCPGGAPNATTGMFRGVRP
jgi:hypothetical protein